MYGDEFIPKLLQIPTGGSQKDAAPYFPQPREDVAAVSSLEVETRHASQHSSLFNSIALLLDGTGLRNHCRRRVARVETARDDEQRARGDVAIGTQMEYESTLTCEHSMRWQHLRLVDLAQAVGGLARFYLFDVLNEKLNRSSASETRAPRVPHQEN
ncbi:hypothetical protein EVAR_14987_1 [Eumeta japonica]|uniref:Uncharacterized protein n=1 Tax=Eumeta variegata TaxID=151549 RepID=A0A4C1X5F6_EUMVA|nr:hypothetical protein EVAR_14987_1 [Eumeta japonica]